jgi:hypothetical protein
MIQVSDRKFWHRRAALPALMGLLLLGLLSATLVLWLRATPGTDNAPVVLARQEALNFFTLDYQHPEQSFDKVLSLAADPFRAQYIAQRDALKNGLLAAKITMTAQVAENGTALEYRNSGDARVIVAVDTATAAPDGRRQTNRYRVRVRLVRGSNGWLVADLTQVG